MKRRITSVRELEVLSRRVDELLGILAASTAGTDTAWSPAVDVVEAADSVVVRVDLPGVDAAQLEVSVCDQDLCITGRKGEGDSGARHYHQMERGSGPFCLEVALSGPVDAGSCRATLRAGVLEVVVPRIPDRRRSVHPVPVTEEEP